MKVNIRTLLAVASSCSIALAACSSDATKDASSGTPASSGSAKATTSSTGSAKPAKSATPVAPPPSGSGSSAASATPSGSAAAPAGSGDASASGPKRTVGAFTEVRVENAIEADIEIAAAAPLELSGDPDFVAAMITEVKDGALLIHMPANGKFESHTQPRVHIVVPSVTALSASSAAKIVAKGLSADGLKVSATDSAVVTLDGKCKTLDAKAETAAKLDAGALVCATVTIACATASEATINATDSATGTSATASKVHVKGSPKTKNVDAATAGTVD